MRTLYKYIFTALTLLLFASCQKPVPVEEPSLEVTPNNIQGKWSLSSWKGVELPEGRYFYIEFTRRDRLFTSYENTASYVPHKESGYYTITINESLGASVISGMKDNSMGEEWNHRYIVTNLTKDSMTWTVLGDPDDVSVFVRVDSFPDGLE